MAKLGSEKRPAVVRVQTFERAEEILMLCRERGWQVIAGVEPDQPENLDDLLRLISPPTPRRLSPQTKRNEPCPCGSGLKYKRCCMSRSAVQS
jgi:SWIM/SEC-C metal-binding protein